MKEKDRATVVAEKAAILWFAIADSELLDALVNDKHDIQSKWGFDIEAFHDVSVLLRHDDAYRLAMVIMRRFWETLSTCPSPPCFVANGEGFKAVREQIKRCLDLKA